MFYQFYRLLDLSILEKYDSQKMYKVYDQWPKIAEESFNFKHKKIEFHNIKHIVFTGMGGSGAIGDVLASILSKTNLHVNVIKGYLLPSTINSKTLIINISVSGNTEETLIILKTARKKNYRIISFSSGGKMEKYCKRNNLEFYKIPMNHSPRTSFVGYLYSIIRLLKPILLLNENNVIESIKQLEICKTKISSENLTNQNPALTLATWLPKIPLIYYPAGLEAAAIRFKNSLQENAKCHAIIEDVIETCHNGIVAWEKNQNVCLILIEGIDDHPKTTERWEILRQFFENKVEYKEIQSVKGNILSKLINLIYLLDYTTIYFAVINEIDPTPVESIDWVKEKLEKNQ